MYGYKGRSVELLDADRPLNPGDRILLRFNWLTTNQTVRAAQYAAVETQLAGRRDFEIVTIYAENEWLDFEILIKSKYLGGEGPAENPEPWRWPPPADPDEPVFRTAGVVTATLLTASLIAVAVIGVTAYLSLRSTYEFLGENKEAIEDVLKTPSVQTMAQTGKVLAYVTGAFVLYLIVRRLT
jgi:hypothetical protein